MRTFAVALGAIALSAVTAPAHGGLISGLEADHRAFAANYLVGGSAVRNTGGGVVALRTYVGGVQQNLSSSMLSERYVLAPIHGVTRVLDLTSPTGISAGSSLEISTGPNAQTVRGSVHQVVRIITFANTSANSVVLPDYVVLDLGLNVVTGVRPVTIRDAQPGEMTSSGGFGSVSPIGGPAVRNFWATGGNSPVRIGNLTNGFNSEFYYQTEFASTLGIPLNWRGLPGDSGASNFGADGAFLGMAVGGTNGTSDFGMTAMLRASNQQVFGDIGAYIPSPGAAGLLVMTGAVLVARRRR